MNETYHGPLTEVSRVGDAVVLVEEVLEEAHATVKVDIDPIPELLLALDGGEHLGLRLAEGGAGPVAVLGVLDELAELLVEVEADVEIEVDALLVEVTQRDTLAVHVGVLDQLPRHAEDEIGLVRRLPPVRVQEGHGLLREGLLAHVVEVGKRLRVELLGERHSYDDEEEEEEA